MPSHMQSREPQEHANRRPRLRPRAPMRNRLASLLTLRRTRVVPLLALLLFGFGPCGRMPGGELSGTAPDGIVLDWGFVNRTPGTCALEVRPDNPHSVTVNCMSANSRLYVGCTECTGKTWSAAALADPRGRILVGETLYRVSLTRITAREEIAAAWSARARKYGQDPLAPLPEDYWLFHLQSR